MERVEIFKRLTGLLTDIGCDLGDIKFESNLGDDLGLDSLDIVELEMRIEEEFDILFNSDDSPENLNTEKLLLSNTVDEVIDSISEEILKRDS